jgi:hypothetical protein
MCGCCGEGFKVLNGLCLLCYSGIYGKPRYFRTPEDVQEIRDRERARRGFDRLFRDVTDFGTDSNAQDIYPED